MTDFVETKNTPPDKELIDELILDLTVLGNNNFEVEISPDVTAKLAPIDVVGKARTETVAKEIASRMTSRGVRGFHYVRASGYETLYNLAKEWGGQDLFTKEERKHVEAEIEEFKILEKKSKEIELKEKEKSIKTTKPKETKENESEEKDDLWEGFEKIGDEYGYTIYQTKGGIFYEKNGRLMSEYTYKTEKN